MNDIDVFISYSSLDRDRIRPLVDALLKENLSVWWDREIGAGAQFEREIEAALDNAKCVVVVWSGASIDSNWVRAEAHEGLSRGVLAPVVIDDVRPPLAFRQTHHVDVSAGYDALVEAIRKILADNKDAADISPHVHYVETPDGARLAYVKQGDGYPVVRSLGWSTSCATDLSGDNVLTNALVRDFRFITYDGRGGGMSAPGDYEWSMDERMTDLKTVIDDADPGERFALFGISEGARTAILYARENPDRVSHLILDSPALPDPDPADSKYARLAWFPPFVKEHWGTEDPIAIRMLCAVWSQTATRAEQRAFMKRQRDSMDGETAARYLLSTGMQNNDPRVSRRVWKAAAELKMPTLIFHCVGDPLAPYEYAQKLAATAPRAELVTSNMPEHGCVLSAAFARMQVGEVKRFLGAG